MNPFNCGVYRWLNIVTDKSYIGSSAYISRRKSEHVRKLTAGSHENPKLQNAWNKYGSNTFQFEMLAYCPTEDLLWQEQLAINAFDATNTGYNISLIAGAPMRGRKASLETKKKLSLARIGKPKSAEHVSKVAESNRGKIRSIVVKKLWSDQRRGKPATKQQLANLDKGRDYRRSPDGRQETSEYAKGMRQRPEVKAKVEAVNKDRYNLALAAYLTAPKHCQVCNTVIMPTPSRNKCFADMGKRKTCSRSCANKVKNEATIAKKEKAVSAAA